MNESAKPTDAAFLARWSRRKIEAKEGGQDGSGTPEASPNAGAGAAAGTKMPETPPPAPTLPAGSEIKKPLPSIDSLTHEADFSPFMSREVDPGLRNQAMKKLFTDPHYQFGQMDKLDIYIDDYSKSEPIPLEMLRQMNQAKSLFLFDEEDKDPPQPPTAPGERAGDTQPVAPDGSTTAQSAVISAESAAKVGAGAVNDPQKVVGLSGVAGDVKPA